MSHIYIINLFFDKTVKIVNEEQKTSTNYARTIGYLYGKRVKTFNHTSYHT